MRSQSTSEQDCPAAIAPQPQSRAPWRVVAVEACPNFCLRVRFADGLEGEADLAAMIHAPNAGVFAVLSDPALFAQVTLDLGAVTWPGGLDLAPDAMHRDIAKTGVFAPQPMMTV
jgi:hypothetical protein